MRVVEEISDAVRRKRLAEYDATAQDRQVEQDAAAGRLEAPAREALRNHRQGATLLQSTMPACGRGLAAGV